MKRTLSILLTLVMTLMMISACSDTSNPNGSESSPSPVPGTVSPTGTDNSPEETGEPLGYTGAGAGIKFDPPITITGVRTAATASMGDYPLDDNNWTNLYLERHGIKVEYLWACDASQFEEKVNLAIMSGEIPDIMEVNAAQYQQLYEADLLQSVDSAFYDYVSADTLELTTEQGELAYEACKREGELYAIPYVTLVKEAANVLYVRKDWLDQTGSPEATTFENFETILADFQNAQLGGVDYCIAETSGLSFFLNVVCPMYGGAYNIWVEVNGELQMGVIQPEIKEALIKYAQWYADGYIDPEFVTNDGSKVGEKIGSGIVGINYGAFWSPLSGWVTAAQTDENIEMSYTVIPTYSGDDVAMPIGTGINSYWVASKDCEHPEAITLMINDFIEKFYLSTSEEDAVTYINEAETGIEVWQYAFCRSYRGFKNYQQYLDINKYLNGEMDYEDLTSDSKGVATRINDFNDGDRSLWGWNQIYGIGGAFTAVEQLIKKDDYIQTAYYGAPTEGMGSYNSSLQDLYLEIFTDIITGEKDISYFDTFVQEYLDQGGQIIEDEVNEWYNNK